MHQDTSPAAADAGRPDASKMPHVSVDVKKREIRIDAEALNPQMSLEFFCCLAGIPAVASHSIINPFRRLACSTNRNTDHSPSSLVICAEKPPL